MAKLNIMKKYLVSTLFLFYAAVSFAQWNLVNRPQHPKTCFPFTSQVQQ
jgi:hypothetical protein